MQRTRTSKLNPLPRENGHQNPETSPGGFFGLWEKNLSSGRRHVVSLGRLRSWFTSELSFLPNVFLLCWFVSELVDWLKSELSAVGI